MIEVRDIVKSYDKLRVLDGVSLDIGRGEIVAVTGPSGAGKTTLLQIVGSLERADSGSVSYEGTRLETLGEKALARFRNVNIGFIFQFHQLLPEFTLLENVEMPALIGGRSRAEARRRAMELIEYLGLGDRTTHKPSQLSGGERQRAAVARALVNNPDILLADEPTGSLDATNKANVMDILMRLCKESGKTLIIVTHDPSIAERCDRIVQMTDGRIEGNGKNLP